MENLQGKCVLLGITGGIAAYKMANVASGLRKAGATVHVIMTENATKFITPLTFETLTNNRCVVDTFARDFQYDVKHISLAKAADVILIAPATANVIAKLAHGLADDMLTTVVLAAKCPKLVAPAMNTGMLENPITQDNIATLERYGFTVTYHKVGWNDYENYLAAMVNTNQPFDIAFTWADNYQNNAKAGTWLDLTPYLENEGAEMYQAIHEKFWKGVHWHSKPLTRRHSPLSVFTTSGRVSVIYS